MGSRILLLMGGSGVQFPVLKNKKILKEKKFYFKTY